MDFKVTIPAALPDDIQIGHFYHEIRRELLTMAECVHQTRALINVIMQLQNNLHQVGYGGISLHRNFVKSFIYTSHEFLQAMQRVKSIVPISVKKDIQPYITEFEKSQPDITRGRDSIAHSDERRAGKQRGKGIDGNLFHGVQSDTTIEFKDTRGTFGLEVTEQTVDHLANTVKEIVTSLEKHAKDLQEII